MAVLRVGEPVDLLSSDRAEDWLLSMPVKSDSNSQVGWLLQKGPTGACNVGLNVGVLAGVCAMRPCTYGKVTGYFEHRASSHASSFKSPWLLIQHIKGRRMGGEKRGQGGGREEALGDHVAQGIEPGLTVRPAPHCVLAHNFPCPLECIFKSLF